MGTAAKLKPTLCAIVLWFSFLFFFKSETQGHRDSWVEQSSCLVHLLFNYDKQCEMEVYGRKQRDSSGSDIPHLLFPGY